ncbi:MAG: hypothetical protein K6A45_06040 [Lachnospiraceae bacterium]|nr:hypothetical protein [Lachnospiraceae bacterium]
MRIGSGVYKRKDGRYEARYRKGINSEGKTVLASVYGRTREEAEAKRAAITKKPTLSRDGDCIWQCSNCGHIVVGKEAPEVCPVCNHPRDYFQLKPNNY